MSMARIVRRTFSVVYRRGQRSGQSSRRAAAAVDDHVSVSSGDRVLSTVSNVTVSRSAVNGSLYLPTKPLFTVR
jgi:hypothetical protein